MPARAWAFLLLSNFLGGSSYVATGFALRGFTPAAAVFWRTLLGGLLFIPAARRAWPREPIARGDKLRIGAVGVFGLALPLVIGTIGQDLSTSTNAALLVGFEPISIIILSALFLGEPLTARSALAVACGLLGSALIVLQGPPWAAQLTPHWKGDALLFLHAVCWSLYTVIGKGALERTPPAVFTGLTTAVALLPVGLAAGTSLAPHAPPASALWAIAFLALGVTFLGTLLWNKALELVPASTMASFIFLQPLVGVALGVLLFGEPLSGWSAGGGLLILSGVVLSSYNRSP